MNKRETVQALMDSVQKGEFELAKSMLADDFQFSGPVSEPIDKEAWLEMSINLKTAFPDLDYHFKMIGTEGDVVRLTTQLSGTHTGALNLVNMKMGMTPATNKPVSAKMAKTRITIKKDKITLWAVEPTYGADLTAILGQLGVEPSGLNQQR
ncbi:MAG: ester cyclase [Anaerolineales bacterium]|nr:ester cyclase [Anaerolineales bacterium]